MDAVDTNVLLYAHDPRDAVKQQKAVSLIQSLVNGVLLWQVACEYISASQKLQPFGYSRSQAWRDVSDFRRVWTTVLPAWGVLDRAENLLNAYSLSFWDAMITASCLEAGIARLFSEDITGYSKINGLEIINPFQVP
jgi:predicted nucleic acid-binding protein